jgi:hypothetical protein
MLHDLLAHVVRGRRLCLFVDGRLMAFFGNGLRSMHPIEKPCVLHVGVCLLELHILALLYLQMIVGIIEIRRL